MIIGLVLLRWLPLHGEADRLLGSQKSRRFCRIAKSPTSFDPAAITSGCRQPLMSAPASVPRVARPSEATAFARPAYFTDIIFFMLSAIHTVANSALVKILPPQQSVLLVPSAGCPSGGRYSVSFWWQMKGVLFCAYAGCPFGGRCSSALSEADEGCPSGRICCGTSRGSMRVVLSGADVGSPPGDRCMKSLRGQIPSNFMKFTWHANLHYRYL